MSGNPQGMCLNPELKITAIEQGLDNQLWLLIRWPDEDHWDYRVIILNTNTFDIQVFGDLKIPSKVPGSFSEFDSTHVSDFVVDANNSAVYYSIDYSDVNREWDYIKEDAEGHRKVFASTQNCSRNTFNYDKSRQKIFVNAFSEFDLNRKKMSYISDIHFQVKDNDSLLVTDSILMGKSRILSINTEDRVISSDFRFLCYKSCG